MIEDAAHTMGARYAGRRIGSDPRSAFSVYSFHPNKNMTTIEGGAIAFHDARHAAYLKLQRFHGIARGEGTPYAEGSPLYDVPMPGRKSNFMDVQAAVGLRQLPKLDGFAARRGALARLYLSLLADVPEVELPADGDAVREHCWNLFVLRNRPESTGLAREELMAALKAENVGTGVHWQGLFGFSFYRDYFAQAPRGTPEGRPPARHARDRQPHVAPPLARNDRGRRPRRRRRAPPRPRCRQAPLPRLTRGCGASALGAGRPEASGAGSGRATSG